MLSPTSTGRLAVLLVVALAASSTACRDTASPRDLDADSSADGSFDDGGPDVGQADSDSADTGDVDAGPYEPAEIWQHVDNECAPARRVVAPETHDAPNLPAEPGDTPRIVWRRNRLCPGDPNFSEPDMRSDKRAGALTRMEVDGESRNLLFVPKTTFGKNHIHWREAVAMLDADTGEALGCLAPPNGRQETRSISLGGRLVAVPELGRVYSTYGEQVSEHLVGEDADLTPDFTSPMGIVSWGPDGSREVVAEWDLPPRGFSDPMWMPNGQILAVYGRRRLVSVDAREKTITWTLGPHDFFDAPIPAEAPDNNQLWIMGPLRDQPMEVVLGGFRRSSDGLERSVPKVDHCGDLKEGTKFWNRMPLENHTLLTAGNTVEVYTESGEHMNTIENCNQVVTVGDERLGCKDVPTYKTVNLDGTEERTREVLPDEDVGIPAEAGTSGIPDSMTAGRGEVLIVPIQYHLTDGSDTRFHQRVAFIPMGPDGVDEPVRSVDIQSPDHDIKDGTSASFLISPTGMVIYEAWGTVYGIQTDIPGLAEGPYPRGPVGGNENRGPVGGFPSLEPENDE